MNLYKIVNVDYYGRRVGQLLLVRANSSDDARKKAGKHLDNKEIYTTGFYDAVLIDNPNSYISKKLHIAKQGYSNECQFYKTIID